MHRDGIDIYFVSAQPIAFVNAREPQIRLQSVVRNFNTEVVVCKLKMLGVEFRPVGEGFSEGRCDVHVHEGSRDLGRLGQVKIERPNVWVDVGSNDLPKNVLRLLQEIFGLNFRYAPLGDLGFRAINVQRRKRAELQRMLVMVIGLLRFIERFLLHGETFSGLHNAPVLGDDLKNDVVYLLLESGARLRQAALGNDDRATIRKEPSAAKQRL